MCLVQISSPQDLHYSYPSSGIRKQIRKEEGSCPGCLASEPVFSGLLPVVGALASTRQMRSSGQVGLGPDFHALEQEWNLGRGQCVSPVVSPDLWYHFVSISLPWLDPGEMKENL